MQVKSVFEQFLLGCRRRWRGITQQQVRRGTLAFFALFLPAYLFFGLQPVAPAEASTYPTLEIPSIDLSTPVEPLALDGSTLTAPGAIAGSFSLYTSPTLLIGHNTTVFQRLDQVKIGDNIIYDGLSYQISDIEVRPKAEINMNVLLEHRTQPTLILMTCAGEPLGGQDYTERLIVTAEAS